MSRQRQVPVIPGWITQAEPPSEDYPTGRLKATRIESLSEYAREYGCRVEVFALTGAELEVLATAETVHLAMVQRAEQRACDLRGVEDTLSEA